MKKIIICIAVLVVAGIAINRIINKKNIQKNENELIVGTAAQYAPWVSINAQGDYEGFDIDVAKNLAKTMGKTVVIKDLGSMASLFMALEQGSIDVIMWGISITKERLDRIKMVRYSGNDITSYPLLFWDGKPDSIKTIEDMAGKTVSVETASAQDGALSEYPLIQKKSIERIDDGFLDIQYKKSDAVLVEPAIAKKFKAKYPEIGVIDMPLSEKDQVYGAGICIKKTNELLMHTVQQAITSLQQAGTISELEEKWGM